MSRNKKILIGAGVVVLLAVIAFVNFRYRRQEGTAVNVEGIRTRDLQAIVSASGKIQPHDSVNVSSDTVGRVTELAVDEGYRVKKGQFLMQIDPILLAAAARQQEASLEAARSTLEQLHVAADSADAALKLAQQEEQRQQQLWKSGLTTRETVDQAESTLKMRQSDRDSANKQINTQQNNIKQQEAGLESAKYTLSKVRIESPIDGIVTARNIQQGETVVVGTMNNAGTVLLTIADMSNVEAQVEVDETDVPNVQLNQKAKITIDAMPGKTFRGHVVEIGNSPIVAAAGTTSSTSATNFLVKVKVDDNIPDIRPGFTCTADITTATRTAALSVPIQAMTVREMVIDHEGNIVRDDKAGRGRGGVGAVQAAELPAGQERKELEGVFLIKDNKAQFVAVKTGIAGDKYFEVLSGLKAGDQVITGPFSSVRELKDGGAVKIDTTAHATTVGSK